MGIMNSCNSLGSIRSSIPASLPHQPFVIPGYAQKGLNGIIWALMRSGDPPLLVNSLLVFVLLEFRNIFVLIELFFDLCIMFNNNNQGIT